MIISSGGEFFADSDKLTEWAEQCRRERVLASDLANGLIKAASIAPPEDLQTLRRLADDAKTLERYFDAMAGAAEQSANLTEEYSSNTSMILDEGNEILRLLQRK